MADENSQNDGSQGRGPQSAWADFAEKFDSRQIAFPRANEEAVVNPLDPAVVEPPAREAVVRENNGRGGEGGLSL